MAEQGEYRFEIADLTPLTLPMRRLQEYIAPLVEIFGSEDDVHFLRVDDGSAVPCIYAKPKVQRRVERRLFSIKTNEGSRKAYQAIQDLNDMLAEDNTSAVLRSPTLGVLIEFPGKKNATDPIVGPIIEATELQGELFQVGGRDETISVYLRHDGKIFICTASRDQGRDISQYLFKQVRVKGQGRWIRKETGQWKLISLVLETFKPLGTEGPVKAFGSLRSLSRELDVSPDFLPIKTDDD